MNPREQSIRQVIRTRASFRSYRPDPIPDSVLPRLQEAMASPPQGPFGGRVRLRLLEAFDARAQGVEKLGTYGMIRGARNYLVGLVDAGPHAMEDFGYVFEWLILRATDLGLATCWLGGTFKRGAFGQAVGAGEAEIIPAVSPVGLATDRRGLVDRVVRFSAGSKKRKDPNLLFFRGGFRTPLAYAAAGPWAEPLEMLRLAPSASNRQPWRVVAGDEEGLFHFFVKRTAGYQRLTAVDLQRIDLGIAMCHWALTAAELALGGAWVEDPPHLDSLPERTEYVASWRPAR